ncbi:hypothetical protein C5167_044719 [Papaver somniferum]|nr:hypothetical protein C5167_044719 [Papaver somniferum]
MFLYTKNMCSISIRQKIFHIGSDVYNKCEVVAIEWLVQEILNFQLFLHTYDFLWIHLKAAYEGDEEMEDRAKYLAVSFWWTLTCCASGHQLLLPVRSFFHRWHSIRICVGILRYFASSSLPSRNLEL